MQRIPYASTIGSLKYTMVCTRPNIIHAVGVINQFSSNPRKEQWTTVKWILKYLRGTSKVCLYFGTDKPILDGYIDTDMASDVDSKKFTFGYLIIFLREAVS